MEVPEEWSSRIKATEVESAAGLMCLTARGKREEDTGNSGSVYPSLLLRFDQVVPRRKDLGEGVEFDGWSA